MPSLSLLVKAETAPHFHLEGWIASRMISRIGLFCFGFLRSSASISFIVLSLCANAQSPAYEPALQSGTVPFESYHGGDIDSVNLATGELTLHIPLVSFPQRGGRLHADYSVVYNTPVANEVSLNCGPHGPCTNLWEGLLASGPTIVSNTIARLVFSLTNNGNCATPGACYSNGAVYEGDGSSHQMGYINATSLRALDGSGYSGIFGSDSSTTVVDSAGVTYYCPYQGNGALPCTATDPNGNQINIGTNGVTDTLGRQIPAPPNPSSFATVPVSSTWTVPGPNGASATYTIGTNTVQITSITLPDQTSFTFQYQTLSLPLLVGQTQASTLSALSKVILPSGGSISYTYSVGGAGCSDSGLAHPIVTARAVDANDGKGPQTWQYDISSGTVIDPLGNKTIHTFSGGPCFPYETETQQFDNGGNLIKTVSNTYSYVTWPNANGTPSTILAPYDVLPTSITTIWPNGQQSKVSYTYDRDMGKSFSFGVAAFSNGQVDLGTQPSGYTSKPWAVTETDYGSGAPGPVLRTTNTTFQWASNPSYFAANLLTIPATVKTLNGTGAQVAETDYTYDESQYLSTPGVYGHATTVNNGLSPTQTTSHARYNSQGMPIQAIDPKGNTTAYSYDGPGAFLSGIQYPTTSGVQHAVGYTFDANTGAITSQTDENGVVTSYAHNDPLGRVTQVRSAVNTAQESWTSYQYPSPTQVTVTQDKNTKGDGILHSSTVYDGLGRTIHQTDPSGATLDTTYDGLGHVSTVSNPHFTSSSPSDGTATYTYDALGRTTLRSQPDGTTFKWFYSGNNVLSTDEAGHTWSRAYDALGRIGNVTEPNGASTGYVFDALGNLTTATQIGIGSETRRSRTFIYDSLSRLTSATNPETGKIGYTYDANGNVMSRTDARGITTSYGYDTLNRLTSRTYSDGVTPTALYVYDTNNISFSPTQKFTTSNVKGRLSVICVNIPGACQSMTVYSYDSMGRTIETLTSTPSNPTTGAVYEVSAAYDLAGNMTSLTYPDGRVVTQGWNGANQLQSVTYASWNGQSIGYPYISSTAYWPNGSLRALFYGNQMASGYHINDRLQIDETSHLQLSNNARYDEKLYCFGMATSPIDSISPPCDQITSGNNGNVLQIKDIVNSANLQTFSYDTVNRITSASGLGWSQQYQTDSFGNMSMMSGNSPLSTFDAATNRIANLPCASAFTPYDASGNQLCDTNPTGGFRKYTWDAEGRILQIAVSSTATAFETYLYDAGGNRISKRGSNGSSTEYINFNGLELAERNGDGSWSDYIFANGQRIARSDTAMAPTNPQSSTTFYHFGRLGSTEALTDGNGALLMSSQYMPFGQEIPAGTSTNHYKFTGKERDAESGLDYFGARYYSSNMGRFSSPDPSGLLYADISNPQSLNLYTYVLNNPLSNTDPTGLTCQTNSSDGTVYDDLDGNGCDVVDKADAAAAPSATVNANGQRDLATDTTNAGINQSLVRYLQLQAPRYYKGPPISSQSMQLIRNVAKNTSSLPNVCGVGAAAYGGDRVAAGLSADTQGGVQFASGANIANIPGPGGFGVKANYTISGGAAGNVSYQAYALGGALGVEVGTQNGDPNAIQSVSLVGSVPGSSAPHNLAVYANIGSLGDSTCGPGK